MVDRHSRIYLILPAKNEEKNIVRVLKEYRTFFMHPSCRFHVVVNHSSDQTLARAHKAAEADSRIVVTDLATPGKGNAIIAGLQQAYDRKFDFIGFVDSDGSVVPTEMAKLAEFLTKNKDVSIAIGSRWIKGSKITVPQPRSRRMLSRFFNLVIRILFRFRFRDTQCGAKLITRAAYEVLLPELRESGFAFDIELLWRAKQHNFKVAEVPIHWANNAQSTVKPGRMAAPILKSLLRIRRTRKVMV